MGIKILAKPVTFNTGKQGAEVAGRSRSIPRPTDPRLLEAQNTPASSSNEKRVKHMQISGQKTPGRVVDKLVREKMLALRGRGEE